MVKQRLAQILSSIIRKAIYQSIVISTNVLQGELGYALAALLCD